MTIKEYIDAGMQRSSYFETAQPSGNSSAGSASGESSRRSFKDYIASLFSSATKSYVAQRDFGSNPAYNYANDQLSVGRFVSQMEHVKRFHLGNEYGSASNNDVFFDGFEDPTHLTFKVEFGEFGASVTDSATLAAIQRTGLASNVYYMDYDQFPMGLLDLNYGELSGTGRGATSSVKFGDQETYNAVNYLLNRNEDRRAQYLRDFVDGLYALERDFPYVFQSVSGLSKLFDFDAGRGQRLKDAVLQFKCLDDGIDQKLHTLMELYRKSAWDDVYQRWVLPDVMRFFKMVVYVFDDRSLHMGNGEFSPDQDVFPIMAFECAPCEFSVRTLYANEYTQDYTQVKNDEVSLEVKVRNVRTLSCNGLFRRVKYVKDIVERTDKYSRNDSQDTFTYGQGVDWRFRWMQRMFMMPDEYNAFSTYAYDGENAAARTHYVSDQNDYADFPLGAQTEIPKPQDTWHRATVTDHSYVIHNLKDLWRSFKSVIMKNTVMIRDSRQADRYYFVNDMTRLDPRTFQYYVDENMVDVDVEGMHRDVRRRIAAMTSRLRNFWLDFDLSKPDGKPGPRMEIDSSKPSMQMSGMDFNLFKDSSVPDVSLVGSEPAELQPAQLVWDASLPQLQMSRLHAEEYDASLPMPSVVPEAPLPELSMPRETLNLGKASGEMVRELLNLERSAEDFAMMEPAPGKPRLNFPEMKKNLDRAERAMTEMELRLDKPSEDLVQPVLNLDRPEAVLAEIRKNLDKIKEDFARMKEPVRPDDPTMPEMALNLAKAAGALAEMVENLRKPFLDFAEPVVDVSKRDASMVSLDSSFEKPALEMPAMQKNLSKPSEGMAALIVDASKPAMKMAEPVVDVSKRSFEMPSVTVDSEKPSEEMARPVFDVSKPDSSIGVRLSGDVSKPQEEMPSALNDVSKRREEMVRPVFDVSKRHGEMTRPVFDVSKPDSSIEVRISGDISKSQEEMPSASNDVSKAHGEMTRPVFDLSKRHEEMTRPVFDVSKADSSIELKLTGDVSKGSVVMPSMTVDVSKRHEEMAHPVFDVSKTDSSIELKLTGDVSKDAVAMPSMIVDVSKRHEEMTRPVFDVSKLDSSIGVRISGDVSKIAAEMVRPEFDAHKQKEGVAPISRGFSAAPDVSVPGISGDAFKTRLELAEAPEGAPAGGKRPMPSVTGSGFKASEDMSEMEQPAETADFAMASLSKNVSKDAAIPDASLSGTPAGISSAFPKLVSAPAGFNPEMPRMKEPEKPVEADMPRLEREAAPDGGAPMARMKEPNGGRLDAGVMVRESAPNEPERRTPDASLTGGKPDGTLKAEPIRRVPDGLLSKDAGDAEKSMPRMAPAEKVLGRELLDRLELLSSVDEKSLEDAPMEKLVRLVEAMETAASEATEKLRAARSRRDASERRARFDFPKMQTAERNTFLGKPMDVPDDVMEKARTAPSRFKNMAAAPKRE